MFTSEAILARLRDMPFIPLRIITSSGQAYDVTHPDLVLVGRRDLTVGVPSNDNPATYETTNRVSILHVTDLQDLPVTSAPRSNGSA